MHCYVCYWYVFVAIWNQFWNINFGYLSSGRYIYVSKDVRIRGYFSKPKGAREQKSLVKTAREHYLIAFYKRDSAACLHRGGYNLV
jgi:hypothetical protein